MSAAMIVTAPIAKDCFRIVYSDEDDQRMPNATVG
jgi:hypothetical protein